MTQFNRLTLNIPANPASDTPPDPAKPLVTIDGVEIKNLMGISIAAGVCASEDGEQMAQTIVTLVMMADVEGTVDVKVLPEPLHAA